MMRASLMATHLDVVVWNTASEHLVSPEPGDFNSPPSPWGTCLHVLVIVVVPDTVLSVLAVSRHLIVVMTEPVASILY
jgi:hypothetical protein